MTELLRRETGSNVRGQVFACHLEHNILWVA
jgi:hypothetical protein